MAIIKSDITQFGFYYEDLMQQYVSKQRAANVKPKWYLWTDHNETPQRLVIKELRKHGRTGWKLFTLFDGEMSSPADLLRLMSWLKINRIEPLNSSHGNASRTQDNQEGEVRSTGVPEGNEKPQVL